MKVIRVLLITLSILSATPLWSQIPQEVTLTVSADGTSKDDATKNALRNAIEQAYGTFVSANTTLLNDDIVKNEIVTISSGNVKRYTELSSIIKTDGTVFVTLEATVSIPGLISYSKQHGGSCEFAGNTFAMNIKLKELRIQNAITAYKNMCLQISELADAAFDYTVDLSEPTMYQWNLYSVFKGQSRGVQGIFCRENGSVVDGYKIGVTISVLANNTTSQIYDIVYNTINAIALSKDEVDEYKKLGYELMRYHGNADDHFSYVTDYFKNPNAFCTVGGVSDYYHYNIVSDKFGSGPLCVLPFSEEQYDAQLADIDRKLAEKMFKSLINFKLINIADESYFLTTKVGLDRTSKIRRDRYAYRNNLADRLWLIDSNGETSIEFKWTNAEIYSKSSMMECYGDIPLSDVYFYYKMKRERISSVQTIEGCETRVSREFKGGRYNSIFSGRIDLGSNWAAWRLPDYYALVETDSKKKKKKGKKEQEPMTVVTPKYQDVKQEIMHFTIPFYIPKDQISNFGGFRIEKNNHPIITNL